jgi:large subunit ribosomal protein L13
VAPSLDILPLPVYHSRLSFARFCADCTDRREGLFISWPAYASKALVCAVKVSNPMKTYSVKAGEIERQWYVVDAEDKILGRLASDIARVLRGKHKPIYTPHLDTGDFVVVVNADKVRLSGRKADQKTYFRHSGYMGGEKFIPFRRMLEKHPERIIELAVKGMLPKGALGRQMRHKLKVYAGAEHPHQAQQPTPFNF